MNHGPAFKKLDNEIKRAVKVERDKGYYGDGKSHTTHPKSHALTPLRVIRILQLRYTPRNGDSNRKRPSYGW
jgi:hypothetical protein